MGWNFPGGNSLDKHTVLEDTYGGGESLLPLHNTQSWRPRRTIKRTISHPGEALREGLLLPLLFSAPHLGVNPHTTDPLARRPWKSELRAIFEIRVFSTLLPHEKKKQLSQNIYYKPNVCSDLLSLTNLQGVKHQNREQVNSVRALLSPALRQWISVFSSSSSEIFLAAQVTCGSSLRPEWFIRFGRRAAETELELSLGRESHPNKIKS